MATYSLHLVLVVLSSVAVCGLVNNFGMQLNVDSLTTTVQGTANSIGYQLLG